MYATKGNKAPHIRFVWKDFCKKIKLNSTPILGILKDIITDPGNKQFLTML